MGQFAEEWQAFSEELAKIWPESPSMDATSEATSLPISPQSYEWSEAEWEEEWKSLTEDLTKVWPQGVSVVAVIAEMRR